MVLQETFGEFNSTERLRSLIRLICQLPGTYEVLIQTGEGEEGILHCANDTIRNAACRNLSGVEALSVILSWPRGKYWLEELPVLPTRSINLPLDRLFSEVEKMNPELKAASIKPEDKEKEKRTPSEKEDKGAPAAEKKPAEPEAKPASVAEKKMEPAEKTQTPPTQKTEPEPVEKKTAPEPVKTEAKRDEKDTSLPGRIAKLEGVTGVMLTSIDGMLLSSVNVEPNNDQVQMIALLGEALGQMGEVFGKGRLLHGAVDFGKERI
ncbi:hypothetical protein GF338_05515, partial [candidate division WOR-3 bacterium]|nr:hypothetical protein [candidate division WOR-3 bacterium]